jgi:hypothetical protein
MKRIHKDELFDHVSQFLKNKGIELKEGSYAHTIQKGCQVLADTINLSQQAVERAKTELEKNFDKARQVIHEKTAPKPPRVRPQPDDPPQPSPEREPAEGAPPPVSVAEPESAAEAASEATTTATISEEGTRKRSPRPPRARPARSSPQPPEEKRKRRKE